MACAAMERSSQGSLVVAGCPHNTLDEDDSDSRVKTGDSSVQITAVHPGHHEIREQQVQVSFARGRQEQCMAALPETSSVIVNCAAIV